MTLLLRWLVYNSDVDIRGSPRSKRKGFFFCFLFFPNVGVSIRFLPASSLYMLFGGCSAPSFSFHRVSPFIRQSSYILRRRLLKGFFFFFFQQSPTLSTAAPAGSSHLSVRIKPLLLPSSFCVCVYFSFCPTLIFFLLIVWI
jgi:hypothetical protein